MKTGAGFGPYTTVLRHYSWLSLRVPLVGARQTVRCWELNKESVITSVLWPLKCFRTGATPTVLRDQPSGEHVECEFNSRPQHIYSGVNPD